MISRTYGQVKNEIARISGSSGMSVTDSRVVQRLNDAIEELMNEGDFAGIVDRWHIVANSGQIVLPSQFDRLMQISINGCPQIIGSGWLEFVAYGPGDVEHPNYWNVNWCGVEGIYERGEVCTQHPIPSVTNGSCGCSNGSASPGNGPWTLRVYAAVPEEPSYCTVQGLAWGTNQIVRTQISNGSAAGDWINGEQISLTNGSGINNGSGIISDGSSGYAQGTMQFSEITAFTKPETNGYIRLTAWNGHQEVDLSNYEPGETTPSYRKYYSPWLDRVQTLNPCCRVVRARCRRRFQPVSEDTDVLLISNLPALRAMVQAQWKRDAANWDESNAYKQAAVDIMRKESASYKGQARTPAISFNKNFSIGAMANVR